MYQIHKGQKVKGRRLKKEAAKPSSMMSSAYSKLQQEFEHFPQPHPQQMMQFTNSSLPYPCVAILKDSLAEGNNYLEFRINVINTIRRQAFVALGICSSSQGVSFESDDINQSDFLWQVVHIQVDHQASHPTRSTHNPSPIYRCHIRLEDECSEGEISILKQIYQNTVLKKPRRIKVHLLMMTSDI